MSQLTNKSHYRQCSLSVMDTIADPTIQFDSNGVSNYYHEYKALANDFLLTDSAGESKLTQVIDSIKNEGKGKPYDCITGISGGVDSSYLVLMAKKWGLRPLIVHFDNGWNSEIAVSNINNIISNTGFDLYTIVVDWEEFKDLQLAYLKASVIDAEVPTDHAIGGTLQKLAARFKVKFILSGNNIVTEAILPPTWSYNKNDYVNLTNIHKKFGKLPLKTYPIFGFKEQLLFGSAREIETIKPLNWIPYNKEEAKRIIKEELGWKDYGGKHYESVFTKFFQAYILPTKFNIDKRKPHLSTLIFSGQLTKEQALTELEKPLYDETELANEMAYVLKKFGVSANEFHDIMARPMVEHSAFGKQKPVTEAYLALRIAKRIVRAWRP
jgi:N-acetyl sugar amidotransferase